NQIAMHIADQQGTPVVERTRLLALVHVAMADAARAIWESKYTYVFWRPVTGIREADTGTGPTGVGDGHSARVGNPTFPPLGASASSLTGPNFTPPFPAYPSGHAGFCAYSQSMRESSAASPLEKRCGYRTIGSRPDRASMGVVGFSAA